MPKLVNTSLKLYAAQKVGVQRFVSAKTSRMILAYGTGCGKTPTAIAAMTALLSKRKRRQELTNNRILVVCPAIVRRHWVHEFDRWADVDALPVEMGRQRSAGSKKALKERDAAYAADVQIVSYDLASHVDTDGWDGIIFDEIHHLSDYTSQQSRAAQRLMAANPGVPALGLSATLIPTELWQLWHPMHLLFGAREWGAPPKAGKIAWQFVGRYCNVLRNEYGCAPGSMLKSREPELRKKLSHVAHRLTREDIANDLPPIDISVLDVPGDKLATGLQVVGKAPRIRPEVAYAVEWYKSLANDVSRAVILVYHRDIAQSIVHALDAPHVIHIDGSMSTAQRVALLAAAEYSTAKRAVLVATTESIREGVRLMWAQKVLLAEWRQSPKQVLQVLGRFNSVGDKRRPQIEVLTDESLYGASRKLLHRMAEVNSLIKSGSTESAVEDTFATDELSDDRMAQLTHNMLATGPRGQDADWSDDTGDDDEW